VEEFAEDVEVPMPEVVLSWLVANDVDVIMFTIAV
jgi:hypothetical protein